MAKQFLLFLKTCFHNGSTKIDDTLSQWLAVAVGGALGSISRWGIAKFISTTSGFPWPTFLVNLSGSLLIGFIFFMAEKNNWNTQVNLLLITGFLGGFTTFSSFGLELFQQVRASHYTLAMIYTSTSLIGGLVCVYFGYKLAQYI
jgi:CrcB protein